MTFALRWAPEGKTPVAANLSATSLAFVMARQTACAAAPSLPCCWASQSSRLVAASSRGKAECRDSAANREDFTWPVYAAVILDAFNSLPSTRPWSRSLWRGTKVARPALTVPDTSASCLAPLRWKPRSAGAARRRKYPRIDCHRRRQRMSDGWQERPWQRLA